MTIEKFENKKKKKFLSRRALFHRQRSKIHILRVELHKLQINYLFRLQLDTK